MSPGKNYVKHLNRIYETSRYTLLRNIIISVISWLIVTFLIITVAAPTRYNLKVGYVAPETITATKQIEDTITTRKLRDEAVSKVDKIFKHNEAITQSVQNNINMKLSNIFIIKNEVDKERRHILISRSLPETSTAKVVYSKEFLDIQKLLLIDDVDAIDAQYISSLEKISLSDIQVGVNKVKSIVNAALKNGIKEDFIIEQTNKILSDISNEVEVPVSINNLAGAVIQYNIKANLEIEPEATEKARREAAEAIEPIVYQKGQNVVFKGEVVTAAQLEMIKNLGLLTGQSIDITMYIGFAIITLMLFAFLVVYLHIYNYKFVVSFSKTLLYFIIIIITVGLNALVLKLDGISPIICQATMGTLLIAILLNPRAAIITNVALSFFIGLMASEQAQVFGSNMSIVTVVSLLAGSAAALFAYKPMSRRRIIYAGCTAGTIGLISAFAIGLLQTNDRTVILFDSLWAFTGSLVYSILCLGTLPIYELIFDVITPSKLLELSNQNHPLLRRLALEAPGTYHHSIIMASLAESAAEAIGANAILARTAAYFHDVGKLMQPEYYSENQSNGSNPHNSITPQESVEIIRSHTIDGLKLAREYHLPGDICDIIVEHHGTMPVSFFYQKASTAQQEPVPDTYRYLGPVPRSKESVVLMICDSIEAAVRSLSDKSPSAIHEKILCIVRDRLYNGQFDHSDISFKDIEKIIEAVVRTFNGIYHDRIKYPEDKDTGKNSAKDKDEGEEINK